MKNWRPKGGVESSLLLLCMVFVSPGDAKAQKSPQPTPTSGSNWVSYDEASGSYAFHGNGVEYLYSVKKGGSFNGLTAKLTSSAVTFYPSYFGGIRAILGGVETNPWDPGVAFSLLDRHLEGDGLIVHWAMKAHGDSIAYKFKMNIVGNTLAVDVVADSTRSESAIALDLDRSYGSDGQAHYIIGIPYLVAFNVLLCDGVFTTFFFDWEVSNASQFFAKNSYHSRSSAYFAQTAVYNKKTDGKRNVLKERLYLTVSPNLDDVLPNIPNPVSQYKSESANRMLWFYNGPIDSCLVHLDKMYQRGLRNLWLQIHEWQRAGFDKEYPDVMPASFVHSCDIIGGQGAAHSFLGEAGNRAKAYGYLFGLHENYVDYYPSAPSWSEEDAALAPEGRLAPAYLNPCDNSREQSYVTKPSKAAYYFNRIAPTIHEAYHTSASYLDVHSSISPGDRVDYDVKVVNAGMFRETMNLYRDLARRARMHHAGPVQGEGDAHMFYQGYYDDIEARIVTGTATSNSGYGYKAPLLVDFDIRKLHSKTAVHGVGNYELFFGQALNQWLTLRFSRDSVLAYIATTLAYGHGAFLASPARSQDFVGDALLAQSHVYRMQKVFAQAEVSMILYNDNDTLVGASDYLRSHAKDYDRIEEEAFMSQVRIEYENGAIVCVNRHPTKQWRVDGFGKPDEWFTYHAIVGGRDSLWAGISRPTSHTLPPKNGWVCYSPP